MLPLVHDRHSAYGYPYRHYRKDGEYLVFVEEDYRAKVLMYRWKP
jgi:hypothetical protein